MTDNLTLYLPTILATAYGILVVIGYIPGIISLVKDKNLSGVSDSFWYFICFTVGISFFNIIKGDSNGTLFQEISLSLNLLLGLACLFILNYRKYNVFGIINTIIFILTTYLILNIIPSIGVTQVIASISIILAYVGQILKFYKSKSSSGTNRWLYLLIGFGLMCLIVSMLITEVSLHIVATETINFILILICYFLSNLYVKKGEVN